MNRIRRLEDQVNSAIEDHLQTLLSSKRNIKTKNKIMTQATQPEIVYWSSGVIEGYEPTIKPLAEEMQRLLRETGKIPTILAQQEKQVGQCNFFRDAIILLTPQQG